MFSGLLRRTDALRQATFLVAIIGWALAAASLAAQVSTHVVAVTGQAAPDNGIFDNPQLRGLNDVGQVLFYSSLTATSGGPTDDAGAFLSSNGSISQLFREGDLVPGGDGVMGSFFVPSLNVNGQVAFDISITDSLNNSNSGIFRRDVSAVALIARKGQTTPGLTGVLGTLLSPVLNDFGELAFKAFLTGASGGSNDDEAIYRGTGGSLTQIAREGQAVPDGVGTFRSFGDYSLNNAGQAAFYASLRGTAGGGADNEGLFRGDGAFMTQIVRKGQAAPDGNGFYGDAFSDPVLNDAGQIAFSNLLTGTVGGGIADNSGVFRGAGTEVTQIARAGQAAPGGAGFLIGLANSNPTMNSAGEVAFTGYLASSPGGSDFQAGIFRGDGGPLTLIAHQGQGAPDGNGLFNFLSGNPTLNEAGQVAFYATLTSTIGGTIDDEGIFIFDDDAGLAQVVRKGDMLLGSAITQLRFPALTFNDGLRGGLNSAGQVAYEFSLADGRRGVAVASFDTHTTINPDFDNDGRVDGRDFLVWQRGLGLTGAAATNMEGNADGDDDIDAADFAAWAMSFGTAPTINEAVIVPEPTTPMLLGLMALGLFSFAQRGAYQRYVLRLRGGTDDLQNRRLCGRSLRRGRGIFSMP